MHSIEQQIYASLAIDGLKAGHHTHASTSGLSGSALERHEQICNGWGEYEPGVDFNRALIQVPLWLDDDPPADPSHYVTALLTYQGRDAKGRPGAMLRHIVRAPAERYQGLDYHPFHLMRGGKLLEEWTPDTPFPVLEPLSDPTGAADLQAIFPERYPLMRSLLGQLFAGGHMHLPAGSDSPAAEETLSQMLDLVPLRVRCQLSVASFAKRNARDYHVAVVRQEDASFRRSLESQPTTDPPGLDPIHQSYLDDLFGAMTDKRWDVALQLIHNARVPWGDSVLDRATQTVASAEPEPTASPVQRREIPPEMPYRRREEPPKRSRLPMLLGLGAGLLIILAILILSRRGGDDPNSPPPDFASLAAVGGDNLVQLVDNYQTAVASLLEGADDFAVQQSLHGAQRGLDATLRQALQGHARVIDRQLAAAASEGVASDRVAMALGNLADDLEESARRVSYFHGVVRASGVDALRARFDQTTRSLEFPPDGALEGQGPLFQTVHARADGMRAAADLLPSVVAASEGRDAASWSGLAAQFKALPGDVEASPAPQLVQALGRASEAMAALIPAEADLSATRIPFDPAALDAGAVGSAARALLGAGAQVADGKWPGSLGASMALYRTWRDHVSPGLTDPTAAAAGLDHLASWCGATPSVCQSDAYRAHVDRWRLELWRVLGGLDTPAAAEALEAHGDAVLPSGGASELKLLLSTLDQMTQATIPVPPDVAAEVRSALARVSDPTGRSMIETWLARNERGSQGEQNRFDRVYGVVKDALDRFRQTDDASGPERFTKLRQALDGTDGVDMRQVRGERLVALRALEDAVDGSTDVRLSAVEVQLMRQADYSATDRPVASLEVVVSRQGQKAPVLTLGFPPMLWAAAAGFEPRREAVNQVMGLYADDRILVVGRDTKAGAAWFHFHVKPPRRGHVVTNLAGEHVVRIDAAAAAQANSSGQWPELGSSGEEVAKVTIVLQDGWWAAYAQSLPDLP